ncbi:hypothetical protein [Hymenobacter metallilatus]|uniref:Uncharacterized protein n=1 Tax=Hymenobacter metallilatus TaxID=2493666 RepID=A0A428JK72_9BACT|nr:hypothetical protein [Hymenobacter metallilatus]RSK33189.1 hypothetical protein EI290_10770 [Hymenobacter metallilatus]
MATRKKSPQTLVLDPEYPTTAASPDHVPVGPDVESDVYSEVGAALCPNCGELLAWHEEPCRVVPGMDVPAEEEPAAQTSIIPSPPPSRFAYALGQPVQPAPDAPARPVIWRGQLKAREAADGLIRRVNVYRLDNGYWDCYYETDLQAA